MPERSEKGSIPKVREIIDLLLKYNGIYKEALTKAFTGDEAEQKFLDIKSTLARKLQILAESISIDKTTVDRIYSMINETLSLKGISEISEEMRHKLDNEWHESYIAINRLLGRLEAQQELGAKESSLSGKKLLSGFLSYVAYMGVVFLFILAVLFLLKVLGILK